MNGNENDNEAAGPRADPDAHGQAALLLAESILHSLVERNVLSRVEALDAVASASEVKVEIAEEAGEAQRRMTESLGLLNRIAQSFETAR